MTESSSPRADQSASDGHAESTAWAIHRLAVALDAVEVRLGHRLGLSVVEFLAVKHVLLSDRPLGPGELAHRIGMSSGSATELVDRLQRRGHVERGIDASDGRRRVIRLTSGFEVRVAQAMRTASSGIDAAAARAPLATRHAFHAFLLDIVRELELWAATADIERGSTR